MSERKMLLSAPAFPKNPSQQSHADPQIYPASPLFKKLFDYPVIETDDSLGFNEITMMRPGGNLRSPAECDELRNNKKQ